MPENKNFTNVVALLFAATVFSLPLSAKISTLFLIGLSFFAAYKLIFFRQFVFNRMLLFMPLFYLMHVVGMLYSSNLQYGFMDLQIKLSFIGLPLIASVLYNNKKIIQYLQIGFVAGCFVAVLICLFTSLNAFLKDHSAEHFFYDEFSFFHLHVTYFSFYLNFAILIIINYFFEKETAYKKYEILIGGFLILLFFISIFLLNGRMSIIVNYATVTAFLVMLLIKRKYFPVWLFMSIGVLVLVGVIHWRLISVYNRFDQFGNFFNNRQEIEELMRANKLDYAQYNSTTSRYAMWKCSAHLITENIFSGVGTGDIKDELVKEYEKTGFKKGVILHYNPHNQYLHTTVALGIIGLSFLLCLFAFALLTSIRQKNYLFAGLLAIIILNALTESVLEVQSGIIFFSVFYCFFMNDIYRKKMLAKEE